MQVPGIEDPTTLSYWLRWKVLLCAICVLTPLIIAAFLIWKYEHLERMKRRQTESSPIFLSDALWKPCLGNIHPVFLLLYRVFAFSVLAVALSFDVVIHGFEIFMFYTQWTFTLVAFYFGLGSLLSFFGCLYSLKTSNNSSSHLLENVEHGAYSPLAGGVINNGKKIPDSEGSGKLRDHPTFGIFEYLFQVLYQMTAGAVTITDVVYWTVIFPFLTLRDYEMNFLTVVSHSLNAVLFLGDTALNRMRFPWFGISYFILLTGVYVIFQWIIHACVPLWWPYPFLDLSALHAPVWYLIVAVMHVPCYYLYLAVVEAKSAVFSRCFPDSYML